MEAFLKALPVIVFAAVIAYGVGSLGKAYGAVTQVEWWARRITGVIFLVVGVLFSLECCFGLPALSRLGAG